MAVYAAIRDEPDDVKRMPPISATGHRRRGSGIPKKVTIFNALVDSGEVLIHDPTGTEIHMTDFRVPHLIDGKPDGLAGCDQSPVRIPL